MAEGANQDAEHVKWIQKRGVAIFASFLMLVFGTTVASEMDHPIFIVDDALFLAIAIISLVLLLYIYRNPKTDAEIQKSLNLFTALITVGVVVKILWVFVEMGDTDAFGDEIPSIIIGAMILASRFV